MKKIINGRIYDSEKAIKLGEYQWENNYEVLYRKKTGEFFFLNQNEKIIPSSWDSVKKWSKMHLESEMYEKLFGNTSKGGKRIIISISLSSGALKKAKQDASKNGKTLSSYIESLI